MPANSLRERREEECDLARSRLRTVASVNEIFRELDCEIAANRAGSRLTRVRRPHQRAHDLVGVGTLDDHRDQRRSRDESDEIAEERLAVVLRVVLFGRGLVELAELEGDDAQLLALEPGDNLADETALHAV